MNQVICISRQVASGGHEIGQRLAEELQIPMYDSEIIAECVKKTGLVKTLIQNHDERARDSLLYSIVMGCYPHQHVGSAYMEAPGDRVFQAQTEVIRDFAEKGPCVMIGRCAGEILHDNPKCCRVFIYAGMDFRRERAVERYGYDPRKAEHLLRQKDRERASYYMHYANCQWGSRESFDLAVDSSKCGVDGAVKTIIAFAESRSGN